MLSVRQKKTRNGHLTYQTPRDEKSDGQVTHGDSFAAEMLAFDAFKRPAQTKQRPIKKQQIDPDLYSGIDLGY